MKKIALLLMLVGCTTVYHSSEECEDLMVPELDDCESSSDCPDDLVCRPESEGGYGSCSAIWTCQVPADKCTRDLVTYCDCDGNEFQDSGTLECVNQKFAFRGHCDSDSPYLHPRYPE